MLIEKEGKEKYGQEIKNLYQTELTESPTKGLIFFGVFSKGNLKAVAAVRCYMGHWYLRGCVVKPEFRGKGLQRKLIKERLEYLASRNDVDVARVSVFPDNIYSIQNIKKEGFEFEKRKKLDKGQEILVFKKELKPKVLNS